MRRYFVLFWAFFVFVSALSVRVEVARADILITPTRVVFGERERFASVTLVNVSNERKTYEMEWKFFEMQPEGTAYKEVEKPVTEFNLAEHIDFSPRRVTLDPGIKQKVRFALRRPPEIPDGDYHVHLKFRVVPDSEAFDEGDREFYAAVRINLSYTIPIILRSGEVSVAASIGDLSLFRNESNNLLVANVAIDREGGPYAVLGEIRIYHVDEGGRETLVGEVSNAHVFPEISRRVIGIQLTREVPPTGSLRVVLSHNNPGDETFV